MLFYCCGELQGRWQNWCEKADSPNIPHSIQKRGQTTTEWMRGEGIHCHRELSLARSVADQIETENISTETSLTAQWINMCFLEKTATRPLEKKKFLAEKTTMPPSARLHTRRDRRPKLKLANFSDCFAAEQTDHRKRRFKVFKIQASTAFNDPTL